MVYDVDSKDLNDAIRGLRSLVSITDPSDGDILTRCRRQRVERLALIDEAVSKTVSYQ